MTKNDFVFCIGYDGVRAIVDKGLLYENRNKTVEELFEAGLYRAAFSKALYANNDALIDYLIKEYNKISNLNCTKKDDLKLLFGVFYPENIEKIKVIYI